MVAPFHASPAGRLKSAAISLNRCLASAAENPCNPENNANICLTVRTTFNAFVDFNAWHRIWGGGDIEETADRLERDFHLAATFVNNHPGDKSDLHLASIEEKKSFVIELKTGKTLHELMLAKEQQEAVEAIHPAARE